MLVKYRKFQKLNQLNNRFRTELFMWITVLDICVVWKTAPWPSVGGGELVFTYTIFTFAYCTICLTGRRWPFSTCVCNETLTRVQTSPRYCCTRSWLPTSCQVDRTPALRLWRKNSQSYIANWHPIKNQRHSWNTLRYFSISCDLSSSCRRC